MSLSNRIDSALGHLRSALAQYAPATFACSFGMEDMVLYDLLHRHALPVSLFTLDTGRLHEETYALMERARGRYPLPLKVMFPDRQAVEEFVATEGVNAFYRDIALRKHCCAVRKIEPLRRALAGHKVWITGLRREQSVTRAEMAFLEQDSANGLMKLSPLLDWSEADVRNYVAQYEVPVNSLHQQGFPSIGCAPCTRAVTAGEDARAGRWWWEQPESKECGLHMDPTGKLVRSKGAGISA